MFKKRILLLLLIPVIIIIAVYIYDFNKWMNILNESNEFYDMNPSLKILSGTEQDKLMDMGFSIQEIEIIKKHHPDDKRELPISLINPETDYKAVLMELREPMGEEYIIENGYLKVYDENMLSVMPQTNIAENHYYIFRLKYGVKKPFFLNNYKNKLELLNNISSSPYFSLILLTYIDEEGNKLPKHISFSDKQQDDNPSFPPPPDSVSFNTRIKHDNKRYYLIGIEIIDIRSSNRLQHIEYALDNSFSKDRIHRVYLPSDEAPPPPKTQTVRPAGEYFLYLGPEAATLYEPPGTVRGGDQVEVIEINRDWVNLRSGEVEGWLPRWYLGGENEDPVRDIEADYLVLKEKGLGFLYPGGPDVTELDQGKLLKPLKEWRDWYFVAIIVYDIPAVQAAWVTKSALAPIGEVEAREGFLHTGAEVYQDYDIFLRDGPVYGEKLTYPLQVYVSQEKEGYLYVTAAGGWGAWTKKENLKFSYPDETMKKIISGLNPEEVYAITSSLDNNCVAYVQGDPYANYGQLYIWKVGENQPHIIENVQERICEIIWSPNSEYLFADIGTSALRAGVIVNAKEYKVIGEIAYIGGPYWSPDSHWVAVGMESEIEPITPMELDGTIDLVLCNTAAKEKKIIATAAAEYYFIPSQWDADGTLHYTKRYYLDKPDEQYTYAYEPE